MIINLGTFIFPLFNTRKLVFMRSSFFYELLLCFRKLIVPKYSRDFVNYTQITPEIEKGFIIHNNIKVSRTSSLIA